MIATPNTEYYGKELIMVSNESTRDRKGLWEGKIVWKCAVGKENYYAPAFDSQHPDFSVMQCERVRTWQADGWGWVEASYAGAVARDLLNGGGGTDPVSGERGPTFGERVYELVVSTGEEPITTHPKFKSHLAGTPASPINGAKFDAETKKFIGFVDDPDDDLYGTESYLDASQCTWRLSYLSPTSSTTVAKVGKIQSPIGPAPTLGAGRNWLLVGISSERRGNVYSTTLEWRASGQRGWNTTIYG